MDGSEEVLSGVPVQILGRNVADFALIEPIVIVIGDVGHLPFVLSHRVYQVDGRWVFTLDLNKKSFLFNRGVEVDMGLQLVEDASVEWSNNGVSCIV